MKKLLSAVLVGLTTVFIFAATAVAGTTPVNHEKPVILPESADKAALRLKELGLFKGVSDTDFALDRAPSRTEALVMLIRLLGKEAEVTKTTAKHPFNDVAAWADQYVAYGYNAKLTNGISQTQFGTSDADAAAYLTFVLRALGYSDANGADFTWNAPFELAKKVGILTDNVNTEKFLRADVALVSKNALTAKLRGTETTLAEKLISEGVFTKKQYEEVIIGTPPVVKEYGPVSQYPDNIKISFESLDHLQANSVLKEAGKNEFADGALKLGYSSSKDAWQGQYCAAFELETKNLLELAHTLAQATYRTDAKNGELRMYFGEGGNDYVVLAYNVGRSAGEWVTSSFAELSQGMVDKINTPKTVYICLHTEDTNASVEIKELDFYCSSEQAQKVVVKAEPIIYKFASATTASQSGARVRYKEGDALFSAFSFGDVNGVKAMKLVYSEHEHGNYHFVFEPASAAQAARFKESDTWYIRVKYMTDADEYAKLAFINNRNGDNITLESNFKTNRGEWRISAPVQLTSGAATGMVERLVSQLHVTLGFSFANKDTNVYVSEIGFFTTLSEACSYYGDMKPEDIKVLSSDMPTMLMSDTAKVKVRAASEDPNNTGNWESNPATGSIMLKYIGNNQYDWGSYRMAVNFLSIPSGVTTAKYVRIVYKATNPADQKDPVRLSLISTGKTCDLVVEDDVKNTNGEWVLSPVQQLYPAVQERINSRTHCTISFLANQGGEYEIREVLFFNNLEDAIACQLAEDIKPINIAGNSIEDYVIVIPESARYRTNRSAETLQRHIQAVTGAKLEIITDAEPKRDHEIVVGNTAREVSAPYYSPTGKYLTGEILRDKYYVFVQNGDLVITGGTEISIEEGIDEFIKSFLTYTSANMNTTIDLEEGFSNLGQSTLGEYVGTYTDPAPVANPDVFTDNFEDVAFTDDYWVEDYASDNWKAEGGVYKTNATTLTTARLHVYERDIDYTAKIRFDSITDKSDAGLLVRYNDVGAFVRVGYTKGQWYLTFSEGLDYNIYTVDTEKATVNAGEWYTLRVTADKNVVKVYVNGVLTLEYNYIKHISPGPMGIFAENAAVSFDDVSVTLVSGQGKILRGVTYAKFWPTEADELSSGSIHEMNDGTLWYVHHNEKKQYMSTDDGFSWTNAYFTDITTDCANLFRLASGNFIKVMDEMIEGVTHHVSYTSSDEGKTWVRGGIIASHQYMGDPETNQTMENDKISQASNGRVFVTQGYIVPKAKYGVESIEVVYYSDDEGKTWTKSKSESTDCTDTIFVGEGKVIEAADGTLMWMMTQNRLGYVIVSESTDNGETWGQFYKLMDLTCAQSSCGIMRDVYAENNSTYYIAWVYNEPSTGVMPRTRLAMAMTTDGRNWQFLGDVFRWESTLANSGGSGGLISHITDPFITVIEDYIFVGSGLSARRGYGSSNGAHNQQHQEIYRIEKSALTPYDEFPGY